MAQWYAKELGKLTGVSVRTLHHYDHIGLLVPSVRLPNGYRLYSAADLIRLQYIIALKFFGFTLEQITQILDCQHAAIETLQLQKELVLEKIRELHEVHSALEQAIAAYNKTQSIELSTIVTLTKVYRMKKELMNSALAKVLPKKEMDTLVNIWQNISEKDAQKYSNDWDALIHDVRSNMHLSPDSLKGKELAKRWKELVSKYYTPELASQLWTVYKSNTVSMPEGWPAIDQDIIAWIEKAYNA